MPSSKPSARKEHGSPVDQGDLKALRGIGPKVEARLKRGGIKDLGQLARTPVNELAALLSGLHGKFDADRIVRERWLEQAAALAAVPGVDGEAAGEAKPVRHSFTVEVRLPLADRDVVSSKVVHVQTGDEETWTGWDPPRLVAFIEDRSRIRSGPEPAVPRLSPAPQDKARPAPEEGLPSGTANEQGVPKPARAGALRAYAIVAGSRAAVIGGRTGAVTATLTFDSAPLGLPASETASVRAEVFARQLAAGGSILVGDSQGMLGQGRPFRLVVPCDLSAASRPVTLFAVVRVFAGDGQARRPAQGLADASLVISTARPEPPGVPPGATPQRLRAKRVVFAHR
jgi:hypothetical protein